MGSPGADLPPLPDVVVATLALRAAARFRFSAISKYNLTGHQTVFKRGGSPFR